MKCPWLDPLHRYPDMRPAASIQRLSPREREVALLLADGLKPLVIARRLNISPGMVSNYIQRIKGRLKLATLAEIAPWVAARRVPGCLDALRRAGTDRVEHLMGDRAGDDGYARRRNPGTVASEHVSLLSEAPRRSGPGAARGSAGRPRRA